MPAILPFILNLKTALNLVPQPVDVWQRPRQVPLSRGKRIIRDAAIGISFLATAFAFFGSKAIREYREQLQHDNRVLSLIAGENNIVVDKLGNIRLEPKIAAALW